MATTPPLATTLDELFTAVAAARRQYGGAQRVTAAYRGGRLELLVEHATPAGPRRRAHPVCDAAMAALAAGVSTRDMEHASYLLTRTLGDARAVRGGRYPQRIARRAVTRRLMRGLFG